MATKSYFIGPQDGWTKVIDAGNAFYIRISASPHTHPIYVFGDPTTTPGAADIGVLVCHHPFDVHNDGSGNTGAGNVDAFWVRTVNPGNQNATGKVRIDVYTDNGTLV